MRGGRRKAKQIRWGMICIFFVAGGSFMSFSRSSSYLSDEFMAGIYYNLEPLFNSSLLDEVKSVIQYPSSLNGEESEILQKEDSAPANDDNVYEPDPLRNRSSTEKESPAKAKDAARSSEEEVKNEKELAMEVETAVQSKRRPPGARPDKNQAPKETKARTQNVSQKPPPNETSKKTTTPQEDGHEKNTEAPVMDGSRNNIHRTGEKVAARATATSSEKNSDKPLNVIILYPDDWRHDDIGGVAPVVRTPFLNKLASEGIRFTYNAATTSICWISRATLFTGQYVSRHGSTHLKYPRFTHEGKWNRTWPYMLQQKGYWVGHVGKWQFWDVGTFLKTAFNYSHYFEGRHWISSRGKPRQHAADTARDSTLKFLKERPTDKPFAITVAFYPPKAVGTSTEPGAQWMPSEEVRRTYDNVTIPEPYANMSMTDAYNRIPAKLRGRLRMGRGRWKQRWNSSEHYQEGMKNYYSLVTQVDKACEEIVNELKAQGLYNSTLIIFTTDNGLFHGAHGLAGKWYPYQESIRIPLIVYDPRMPINKRGTLDDSFTLNIDLAETILGAAGINPDPMMQGRDISDLYLPTGRKLEPWRDEFYYEFPIGTGGGGPKATALVRKDFKYMRWPEINLEQLYNLQEDPLEFEDLRDRPEHKDRLEQMRKRHDELKLKVFEPCKPKMECDPFQYGNR